MYIVKKMENEAALYYAGAEKGLVRWVSSPGDAMIFTSYRLAHDAAARGGGVVVAKKQTKFAAVLVAPEACVSPELVTGGRSDCRYFEGPFGVLVLAPTKQKLREILEPFYGESSGSAGEDWRDLEGLIFWVSLPERHSLS